MRLSVRLSLSVGWVLMLAANPFPCMAAGDTVVGKAATPVSGGSLELTSPSHSKEGSVPSQRSKSFLGNIVSRFGLGDEGRRGQIPLPSLAPMIERVSPAVVNISTQQMVSRSLELPFDNLPQEFLEKFRFLDRDRPRRVTSLGSGVIIDKDGYILTNYHVIADADEITIILHDETELKAKVIGRDSRADLALLKVEAPYDLPFLEWGDSTKIRVGDWGCVIGNPYGLGGSVTIGIVSALARDISRARGAAEYFDDLIQTDALVNVGNSGGPLLDMSGRMIGINTAILSPTGASIGISFAIPSSLARPIAEQLKQYGRTKRGWIGVQVQPVDKDIAENIGMGNPRGALVARVSNEGPAATAGLKTWDVILKFDGVTIPDPRKLTRIVGETPVGKQAEMVVWRNQQEEKIMLTVGQLEDLDDSSPSTTGMDPKHHTFDTVGLVVATLTPELRRQMDMKTDLQGVIVIDIKSMNSSLAKLRPDDVIVEVERKPIKSVEEFSEVLNEAVAAKKKTLLIQFYRDDQPGFGALKIETVPVVQEKEQMKESGAMTIVH